MFLFVKKSIDGIIFWIKKLPNVLKGIFFGLFAVLVWGGFPVVTKFGIDRSSLDAYDLVFIRYCVAGILMLPYLLKVGLKGVKWYQIFLMVTGIGAPYILTVSFGLGHAPIVLNAVIVPGSMILFSAFLSIFILKSHLLPCEIIGILLLVIGILLTVNEHFHLLSENILYISLLFVLAGFLWAVYTVTTKAILIAPMKAMAIVCVFSLLFYAPSYLYLKGGALPEGSLYNILFHAVYQGILGSVIALYFYNRSVFYLGAPIGSSFTALIPVISIIAALFFLGEQPNIISIIGIFVVILGMLLVLLSKYFSSREEAS